MDFSAQPFLNYWHYAKRLLCCVLKKLTVGGATNQEKMSKHLSNSESAFVSSKNTSPPMPSSSASAFLSHQEGGEISAYAEIYFRIYSDKFSYIRKYISLYTQIYFSIYTTKRGSEYCSGTLQLQKNESRAKG